MVTTRTRDAEGCETQPELAWDSVWINRIDASGGYADWTLADADETGNRGGLRAKAALHTATMLCLFTDKRRPADLPTAALDDPDPRGWWGDQIRIEGEPEVEMGSLLWLLERAPLTDSTIQQAYDYATEALAVLKDQGAVAATEVEVLADKTRGLLGIEVRHFSAAGGEVYRQQFDVVWQRTLNGAESTFGERRFF